MASQNKSLRRPRGLQKRFLSSLASQEAPGMDFGNHLDPLGVDFEATLEVRYSMNYFSEVIHLVDFTTVGNSLGRLYAYVFSSE